VTRSFTDLRGKVAVVVGATSGLGRAIAIGLAEAGADVVPTGRRKPELEEVCARIEAAGSATLRQTTDVARRASLDALRDAALARFGRVDILVNAAGKTARRPTVEVGEEEWQSILDINLTGMLRACQSFHAALRDSGRGRVLNLASLASFAGFLEVTAYGVSKAGVIALTRQLAVEWAKDSITVNALVPGVFPTELNEKLLQGTERGRELLQRTPMRRFGKPEELSGAAVFLASDAAGFITGQCLAVDGGFLASGVNS
jgi:NAD(P)-dependent dehydrogenase (short-subunit alcohol dehydrogenase family)